VRALVASDCGAARHPYGAEAAIVGRSWHRALHECGYGDAGFLAGAHARPALFVTFAVAPQPRLRLAFRRPPSERATDRAPSSDIGARDRGSDHQVPAHLPRGESHVRLRSYRPGKGAVVAPSRLETRLPE